MNGASSIQMWIHATSVQMWIGVSFYHRPNLDCHTDQSRFGLVEARSTSLSNEVIDNLIKNSAGVYTEFGENLTNSNLSSSHNLMKRVAVIHNIRKPPKGLWAYPPNTTTAQF